MNFLAHLYLSGDNNQIMIGNFIADAVKGSSYKKYPKEIQDGIVLHRAIDEYTDRHDIVRKSKHRLNERYNHYAGVIIDILYDHFLAKNWEQYSDIPLEVYAQNVYDYLQANDENFPDKIKYILPYMVQYNWLVHYATIEGIGGILSGMNKRTQGISQMDQAVEDLKLNYTELESDFTSFFEELRAFSLEKTHQLLSK